MKYLLVILMSCMPFSVAALLAHQPAGYVGPESAISREAALKDLGRQKKELCRRMLVLQARGRNFLPRGGM